MTRKLSAFTLFELVIGMLLSAIVIGMVYKGYTIIGRIYNNYITASIEKTSLMTMETVLQRDFDRAVIIQVQQYEILLLDSLGSTGVSYFVTEDKLIRNGMLRDTFKLDRLQVSLRFESVIRQIGLVDGLSMMFYLSGKPTTISVEKKYSAQQLFNYNQLWNQ